MGEWDLYPSLTAPASGDTLLIRDISATPPTPGTVKQVTVSTLLGIVGYVYPSGDTSGAGDPAALNAAITAASALGGGTVKGIPSGPWYVNTPIVLKSGVTLDMTGCVITEVAGSNCNMVTNASAVNAAVTGTGSMTSGANTLTTTLGAVATVGQSVYVAGAANGGANLLCGIVGAQTSTTITVVDFLGNALNAGATVSGVAVSLYNRDTQIELRGGTWNRGANGFTGGGFIPGTCGFNFRRTDGLHVHDLKTSCTGKGYQTLYGDCTNFHFHDITVSAPITYLTIPNTDGIHGWGPLAFGTVENIFGTCGDDFVILDCLDPGLTIDVCGPIRDVTISKLYPGDGSSPNGGGGAVLLGNGTFGLTGISVKDVHGSSRTYGVCLLSTAGGNTNPSNDIFIDTVTNTTTGSQVGLGVTGGGSVTLRNLAWKGNSATTAGTNMVSVINASNLGALTIDGMSVEVTAVNVNGLFVDTGCTVGTAIVKNVNQAAGTGLPVYVHGTVTVLGIDGFHVTASGSNPGVYIDHAVGKLQMGDVYFAGSTGALIGTSTAATAMQVLLSNVTLSGCGSLADAETAMDFIINGINVQSITGGLLIWLGVAASTVTVRGAGMINPGNQPLFGHGGTPTTPPRVVMAEALADVSQLNRGGAGDIVTNTNGALACGTGVVISSGSGAAGSWKNLFTGSTY